jgi:hypothetical protein
VRCVIDVYTVERELTTYSHHNSTMEGEKTSTIRG